MDHIPQNYNHILLLSFSLCSKSPNPSFFEDRKQKLLFFSLPKTLPQQIHRQITHSNLIS